MQVERGSTGKLEREKTDNLVKQVKRRESR